MVKTVTVEVTDYLNRNYLNKVARTLVRCSRNFNVEEIDTESYGVGNEFHSTTLSVTNKGYTTFNIQDWGNELKDILKNIGPAEGIIYLKTDDGLICLNDIERCKMCGSGEATHEDRNKPKQLCDSCWGDVNC